MKTMIRMMVMMLNDDNGDDDDGDDEKNLLIKLSWGMVYSLPLDNFDL